MAGQNQTDPVLTWAAIIGMFVTGMFGLWIVTFRFWGPIMIEAKRLELYPLTFISDSASADYDRLEDLRNRYTGYNGGIGRWQNQKRMWAAVVIAGKQSGLHYRHFVGFTILGMMVYILFFRKNGQFRTVYNLQGLMAAHAKRWPVITPFVNFIPTKEKERAPGARVPVDLPLFSESLYPEEWMAHNRIRVINGVPDRDQIRRALLPQLGDKFEGIDALPEHLYCILAALALKGGRKREACDALFGEIAKCWTPEKGFVPSATVKSQSSRALSDQKLVEPLLNVLSRHAYVATAFIAALKWARRQGGVLAPAQFVWLRGEDRAMWYPLNNVDRRAFHVEAAGAMAHYMAEVEAGRLLSVPRLDAAVVAIVQYISETRARIPELEGGTSGANGQAALPNGNKNTPQIGQTRSPGATRR